MTHISTNGGLFLKSCKVKRAR